MAQIVIGLGSNLDSPREQLTRAVDRIAAIEGLTILARSKIYDTDPVGPPQPRYLNAAILVGWRQSPERLLVCLLEVECAMGRVRTERWGPRVIDLDLLWSSEGDFKSAQLTIPHPELTRRSFALSPLLDVVPGLREVYGPALEACGDAPQIVGML